jgi:NAD-dependent dihydropyrimidine dehydrogenase PreA subunit
MKDLYQDLLRYYCFAIGKLPDEANFLKAMKETVTPEELRIFFMLPFTGNIAERKLLSRARRAGVGREEFFKRAGRLVEQGMIMRYSRPGGQTYERGNIVHMSEQQVRIKDDTPRRRVFARLMDAAIEGEIGLTPNRTPFYRVLPVEETLAGESRQIDMDKQVRDPRAVLPLDIASAMVRAEPLVAVADCYCRAARRIVGKDCGHPLETCLTFNELAETLLEAGLARRIDHAEAVQILQNCEREGLVHFVDNAEGRIRSLCNCCPCSCILLSVLKRDEGNAGGPSRYVIRYSGASIPELAQCVQICPMGALSYNGTLTVNHRRCIGCGLCVSRCRELGHGDALRLVPRGKHPRIHRSNEALWKQITRESAVGLIVNKLKGKK